MLRATSDPFIIHSCSTSLTLMLPTPCFTVAMVLVVYSAWRWLVFVCIPDVTLQEQAAIAEIGGASQTAGDLPVLLHDLHHFTHSCQEKKSLRNLPESSIHAMVYRKVHHESMSVKESSLSGVQSVKSGTKRGTLSMFLRWGRTWWIPRGNLAWGNTKTMFPD